MMRFAPGADRLIASVLGEDLGVPLERLLSGPPDPALLERDVTSSAVLDVRESFSGLVRLREAGVVCGLPYVDRVYSMLSHAVALEDPVEVFPLFAEGASVAAGTAVAEIDGDARTVLAGERSALNLLAVLSGIATEARRWHEAAPEGLAVLDTRKTLPGMREVSKYAVRVGGAENHRAGLYDMVLVKDNHLARSGGVAEAVSRARERSPEIRIEVEAEGVAQAIEAAAAGADIVLLDNMPDATLRDAVAAVRAAAAGVGREVVVEASGNIGIDRLPVLRGAGVDRVSTSALTLAKPLDVGLDEKP